MSAPSHTPVRALTFRWTRPGPARRAFTLIEIAVVVGIIAVLAAFGIQQIPRARITTNEQLALSSLRLLAKSCQFYFLTNKEYPSALADLGPAVSAPAYVSDMELLAGVKQGYRFTYAPGPGPGPMTFTLLANPQSHGGTGVRNFFMDQTMTIHATDNNQDATAADPVVPQ